MWAAHEMRPYPFQTPGGHCIGRVLMSPTMFRGQRIVGLVPFDALMEREFAAREKRQNRRMEK